MDNHLFVTHKCMKALTISFSDVTEKDYKQFDERTRLKVTLFSKKHADNIITFLNDLDAIEILVVHCAAGISRSGAVGLFACRYFNNDESTFKSNNLRIHPNHFILEVLNEVSGIKDDYMTFWVDYFDKNERMRSQQYFNFKNL